MLDDPQALNPAAELHSPPSKFGCHPPRMADFAKWVMAAAPALDATPEQVLEVYEENHFDLERDALESNILCHLIRQLLATRTSGPER